MRIGKRWARRLAAGVFLLCAAGLVWMFGAEAARWREPAYPADRKLLPGVAASRASRVP